MKNNIYFKYIKPWGINLYNNQLKSASIELFFGAMALIAALLVGAVFILLAEASPVEAYKSLFDRSFGSINNFYGTLFRATPLILTGLAVAFSFRSGLFNIGVEGQYLVGAFAAAWAGFYFTNLPRIIHLPLTLIIAMLAGGIFAGISGVLKAKLGANEVINSIMLNYIATILTISYGIGRLNPVPGSPSTPAVLDTAKLKNLGQLIEQPAVRLHQGFIFAVIAAIVVWYLLYKTKTGYEIRAVGLNSHGAEAGGVNVAKTIILSMFISGVIAGLAGAGEVLGTQGRFIQGMNMGYGFTGIAVALVANNNPFGIIISGILFGALAQGGIGMNAIGVPRDIVTIIQALVIFAIAISSVTRAYMAKKKQKEAAK